jgi:hypothetical protein
MTKIVKIIPKYRALYVEGETIYAAKGYKIYKSFDGGEHWILDGRIRDWKHSLIGSVRLLARLLRIEVSGMMLLDDGSRIVIAKKGIFIAKPHSNEYVRTFNILRGSKPMNMCQDGKGNLYFGEYLLNGPFLQDERDEVHVYKSEDGGYSWHICYTFPKNTIRHIHGVYYDKFADKVWFTSGDRGDECIIGNTDDGFESINIVKRGGQKYRAVKLFFYKDFIVYGTDTQIEKNFIYRFDRNSGDEVCIQEVQGSVISGVQGGNAICISTAIEPSEVNKEPYVHLWYTPDGKRWSDIYKVKHDSLSLKYFQFAKMQFPHHAIMGKNFIATGHAVKGLDGKTVCFSLE